jgi:hypothetical protein
LENLFLGLLGDMERSTRVLNDREIERGIGKKISKSTGSIPKIRKRRLEDGDEDGSGDDEDEEEGEMSLKLKNRTTG